MTATETTAPAGAASSRPPRIGVPRALHFYKYYPLWEEFLQQLGFEVVLSRPTTKAMIEEGAKVASSELCIPLKIYFGHVMELARRTDLDYLFVPRYVSLDAASYFCPKFMILPETVIHTIRPATPVLSLEVNSKAMKGIEGALKFGHLIGKSDEDAGRAWVIAVDKFRNFRKRMGRGDYIRNLTGKAMPQKKYKQNIPPEIQGKYPVRILILGHAYNVYERELNMDITGRLAAMDAEVVTQEQMPDEIFKRPVTINREYHNYWGHEEEILQVARHFLLEESSSIDGAIFLISFACGPDSLIQELIMRDFKRREIPYQALILDEHSGESGLVTRVEAFVDMIRRAKYAEAFN